MNYYMTFIRTLENRILLCELSEVFIKYTYNKIALIRYHSHLSFSVDVPSNKLIIDKVSKESLAQDLG